jgi:formylglycine-generating enzyme required for sulfatase activity
MRRALLHNCISRYNSPMSDYALRASIGLLKRVPGGTVRLGSRYHPREVMRRVIYIPEFELAQSPVTTNQYSVFIESGGYTEQKWWSPEGWAWAQGAGEGWGRENRQLPEGWEIQRSRSFHPITGVGWFEAEAYCRWLAAMKRQAVRLPTEDEWERAARGDDERPFPWGDGFAPTITNTVEADLRTTVPAGSLEQDVSPFGVLEMSGNVQEWTSSTYAPFEGEVFPAAPPFYAARGGSFNDTAYGARAAYRRAYPPGYFFPFLGFRIVVGT